METVLGVLVDEIPGLANILQGWSTRADQAIDLVTQAEVLSDLTVQVSQPLLQIGTDGRTMAQAIEQATAEIVSHQLVISTEITPLSLVSFASRGAWQEPGDGAGDASDQLSIDMFGSQDDSSPEAQRIGELIELIRGDTLARRDSSERFRELNPLLGHVTGDSSPAAATTALSLLLNGLHPSQLKPLFVAGHDGVFGNIAFVMAHGQDPAASGFPVSLFPSEYVEWHRLDALRRDMQLAIDENLVLWKAVALGAIRNREAAQIRLRIDRLHPNDPGRAVPLALLQQDFQFADLDRYEKLAIADYFAQADQNLQAAVDAQSFDVRLASINVSTIDGRVHIEPDGSLTAFDAIGAAAATVPVLPGSFVGVAYARSYAEFEFDEVMSSTERVAGDEAVATSFFNTLGADSVTGFVNQYSWGASQTAPGRFNPAANPLVRNLSLGLGLASQHLDPTYAAELVQATRPPSSTRSDVFGPEWLFAHGDFAAGFLLQGAAASVILLGGGGRAGGGLTEYELMTELDPRIIMIDRIVGAGLGAEFVHELDLINAIDALVWAEPPIQQPAVHHLAGTASDPGDGIALVSHLFVQASASKHLSTVLIDSVGSKIAPLDVDVANGLSVVLGGQVTAVAYGSNHSAFLDGAENIFRAGAGVDIDVAMREAVIDLMSEGLNTHGWDWYSRHPELAAFTGRVDGRKFNVFHADAVALDRALENTEKWVSAVFNTTGVVVGLAGALPSAGASLSLTGVGVTGSGWIAPMFLDPANNELALYQRTVDEILAFDDVGEGLTLIALARTGALKIRDGSFTSRPTTHGLELVLEMDGAPDQSWVAGWDVRVWVDDVVRALVDVNAVAEPQHNWLGVETTLNNVGNGLFSDPYRDAYRQETSTGTDG